jgi:hypothetical protein
MSCQAQKPAPSDGRAFMKASGQCRQVAQRVQSMQARSRQAPQAKGTVSELRVWPEAADVGLAQRA